MMRNQEVRSASRAKKVQLWKVADYLEISEATMTRKLRRELPESEKQKIFDIIDTIAATQEQEETA